MRFPLFKSALGGFLLLAAVPALGQEAVPVVTKTVNANGDTLEQTRFVPAPRKLVTAEDSARERLRQANARRLRQQAASGVAPATELHLNGGADRAAGASAPTPPPPTAPPAPPAKPDQKALERAARSREKAAQEAARADEKRQRTLEKRTRD